MPHVITLLANPVVKGLSTWLPEDHVVAGGVTEIYPSHHLVVHRAVHLKLIRGEIRVEVNDGVRNAQGPPKSVTTPIRSQVWADRPQPTFPARR